VEADPKEIQEMLAHLITNGIEAMPEGGDLYLSTEENAGMLISSSRTAGRDFG